MRAWIGMTVIFCAGLGCSGSTGDDSMPTDDGGARNDAGPPPGEHGMTCAEACADPGPDDVCGAQDFRACERYCLEVFDGFSDACAGCIVQETTSIGELLGACAWGGDYDRGFAACNATCAGNRETISRAALLKKCESFCVPDISVGGFMPCVPQAEADCINACQNRFVELPNACAACLVGSSVRPATSGGGGTCRAPFWTTTEVCAPYCE